MRRRLLMVRFGIALLITLPSLVASADPLVNTTDHGLIITFEGRFHDLELADPAGRVCSPGGDRPEVEFEGCEIVSWENMLRPRGDHDLFQFRIRDAVLGTYRMTLVARDSSSIDLQVMTSWRTGGKRHDHALTRDITVAEGDTLVCALSLVSSSKLGASGVEVDITETRRPRSDRVTRRRLPRGCRDSP